MSRGHRCRAASCRSRETDIVRVDTFVVRLCGTHRETLFAGQPLRLKPHHRHCCDKPRAAVLQFVDDPKPLTWTDLVAEEFMRAGRLCDESLCNYILWEHTGFPNFWNIPEDGATPEECCRKQVRAFLAGECVDDAAADDSAEASVT